MRKMLLQLVAVSLIFTAAGKIHGHGVRHSVSQGKAVTVKISYEDGEAMSYAPVKIYAPGNREVEFQNGRTDRNGSFAFLPTVVGEWTIKVEDETGHGAVVPVSVNKEMSTGEIKQAGLTLLQKIIMAACAAWGAAGTALFFMKRKKG
jgi:nickel transport protein